MKEIYFTLTEDCIFENEQLNKGDIILLVPVPADDKSIREMLEEEEKIDYRSLLSVYVYTREDIIAVAQDEEDWIFCHMPKYCTYIHSDWLPDLFLKLPITSAEIELDNTDATDENA